MPRLLPFVPSAVSLVMVLSACGGGGESGDGDSGGADAGVADPCGFGSGAFLPFEAGFAWTYQTTDLGSGEREVKSQNLAAKDDPTFGEVLEQVTTKPNGETHSLFRVEGGLVKRLQQLDLDATGTLERTTLYDPYQLRIDETEARVMTGATWEESYTETETPAGGLPVSVPTEETWEVLGVDVACESPLGSFKCLHLRRTRTAGGVAQKEFFFAPGIGKIREVGANQLEELTDCSVE